ncbi:hypothetical protein [Methylocella sp.]|uniref:WYL domain-containing protein n=1 Tax=Methylocella sp. TaxID=1978226 RepID=UPI0035B18519
MTPNGERIGAVIKIEYIDRFDQKSSRTVRVENLSKTKYGIYLTAFCMLYHAERTFRLDGIQSLKDQSGKSWEATEYFGGWIAAIPELTPLRGTSPVGVDLARPGVLALMWVQTAAPDRDDGPQLLDYIRDRLASKAAALTEDDEAQWAYWLERQTPTFDVASACVRRLGKAERALVDATVARLIASSPDRVRRARRLKIGDA